MNFDKKYDQESRMKQILSNMDEDNMVCVDCGNNVVEYASINNGILICFSCSQKHKNLGNQLSYVISIGDKWDNYLIKYISSGGNSRFKQFCKNYFIDNLDISLKYKTRACEYYREIIRSEVMGFEPPNNIDVSSASQILTEFPNNYPEFEGYTFVKQVDMNALENKYNKKKNNKVISSISGFFSNFSKKVNDAADSFVDKVSGLKGSNFFTGNYANKIKDNNSNINQIKQDLNNKEINLSNEERSIENNNSTCNQNDIYIDSKEFNEIIKNAKEAHKVLINKDELKKDNNIKEELINNIEEKKGIKENIQINKIEEKRNNYGLDDNDDLLKKIEEIEGTN